MHKVLPMYMKKLGKNGYIPALLPIFGTHASFLYFANRSYIYFLLPSEYLPP